MAIIKFTLAPAWKRIVTDAAIDEDVPEQIEEPEPEPVEAEPATDVAAVEARPDASKRRLITARRVLALGVVIGALAMVRRASRVVPEDIDDVAASIDVETAEAADAEQ